MTTEVQRIGYCFKDGQPPEYATCGTVNGVWVSTIIRDSGCSCILVSEDVLPDIDVTGCRLVEVSDYLGRRDYFPEVRCYIKCPYYTGWAKILRTPISFCCVLIGIVPGARILCEEESESAE